MTAVHDDSYGMIVLACACGVLGDAGVFPMAFQTHWRLPFVPVFRADMLLLGACPAVCADADLLGGPTYARRRQRLPRGPAVDANPHPRHPRRAHRPPRTHTRSRRCQSRTTAPRTRSTHTTQRGDARAAWGFNRGGGALGWNGTSPNKTRGRPRSCPGPKRRMFTRGDARAAGGSTGGGHSHETQPGQRTLHRPKRRMPA